MTTPASGKKSFSFGNYEWKKLLALVPNTAVMALTTWLTQYTVDTSTVTAILVGGAATIAINLLKLYVLDNTGNKTT